MKEWAFSCLVSAFILGTVEFILPEKKAKLTKEIKLICGLILILIVFSPLLKLLRHDYDLEKPSIPEYRIVTSISEKTLERISQKLSELYPNEKFTLSLTEKENGEIEKIILFSDSVISDKIAKSIERLYDLKTEVRKYEG